MKRFLEAAWWFLLGAFLMHISSAYVLRPLLEQPTAADLNRSFFTLALLAIAGLAVVGMGWLFLVLARRSRGAS